MLRPDMAGAPAAMTSRPVDHRGFYVPWFVTRKTEDDLWDFAGIDVRRFHEARLNKICWVSGAPLGKYASFVVGPMCCINRIAGDPPTKREIAEWSAKVCPFLSRPLAKRPSIPEEHVTGGIMVPDNPGTVAVWTCLTKDIVYDRPSNLFFMGDPTSIEFFHKGEPATKDQTREAMKIGARRIKQMAEQEDREKFSSEYDPETQIGPGEMYVNAKIDQAITLLEKMQCL